MVKPKTEEEIALLRENAIIVSKTLAEVGKRVAPGVTTLELNRVADEFIRDNGAIPSFLGYDGFPAALWGTLFPPWTPVDHSRTRCSLINSKCLKTLPRFFFFFFQPVEMRD